MSILKEFGELFKVGFMSDSAVKKFAEGSGIAPAKDYQKETAQNTSKLLEESKKTEVAVGELSKAIAELRETISKNK